MFKANEEMSLLGGCEPKRDQVQQECRCDGAWFSIHPLYGTKCQEMNTYKSQLYQGSHGSANVLSVGPQGREQKKAKSPCWT